MSKNLDFSCFLERRFHDEFAFVFLGNKVESLLGVLGILFCISICSLTTIESARAENWDGFRGLSKQGWAGEAAPSVDLSGDARAEWSVGLPGEGHSSPIVHGEVVYITSAYETQGFKSLLKGLDILNGIIGCLALFLGFCLAIRLWRSAPPGKVSRRMFVENRLIPFGLAIATCLLVGAVLTSDRWINLDENSMRAWKGVSGLVVLALFSAMLCFPSASRGWLILAALTPFVSAVVFQTRPDKRELFQFDSVANTINNLVPFVPIGLGLVLIAGYIGLRHFRRRLVQPALPAFAAVLLLLLASIKFSTVFFLESSSELVRAVHALNLDDGTIRWTAESLPGRQELVYHLNSTATPTPVTDGVRIVSYFGSAGLFCIDLDGNVQWTREDLPSECRFSHAASPVLHDGILIITRDLETTNNMGSETEFFVTALSAETGDTLWEHSYQYPDTFANYSSPAIYLEGDEGLVWVRTWKGLLAFEPDTGSVVWKYDIPYDGDHLVASPVIHEDRVYILDGSELICLSRSGNAASEEVAVWRQPIKGEASASPVFADGRLFIVTEKSYASCYDAETGEKLWEEKFRGKFFASVIAAGGVVYFCSERGEIHAVANEPEYRKIWDHQFAGKIYSSVTPVGSRVLVRSVGRLYCFGEK